MTMRVQATFIPAIIPAIAAGLIAAGCGGYGDGAADPVPSDPGSIAAESSESVDTGGSVFVSGSSTVEPISIRVAEMIQASSGGTVNVTVEGPGTGDGFKKFCAGETDISDASRPIKDEEAAACAENGIEYVELEVAFDGLSVITNPDNAAVECLDVAALYALLGPESEGFGSWSDANALATELGSASVPLPDAPLSAYGPGEESGTYDSFVEFAIADFAEERLGEDNDFTRADYSSSPNDNFIVDGIEGSATSLGWVGYAFYEAEQESLKALAIDSGDGCVAPSDEAIASGAYGFSRSLFIYVNTAEAAANPAVRAFVDLYLSDEGLAAVPAAGYVSLPADRVAATREAWSGI